MWSAIGDRYLPPDTRDARTDGGRLDLAGALSGTGALLALAGAALVAAVGVACALAMLTRQPAAAPETHELEGRP
ncbi:hypothetical protein AB0392_17370 [Nonomuraea angiospora]|uniref:hypothetical protein n=1 Tax=Nonomuraea angiospora TaxID=46172 RepID=UPI00344ED6C4